MSAGPIRPANGRVGMSWYGAPEALPALYAFGRTLCPLCCVHEHMWIVVEHGAWDMEMDLERFWTCLEGPAVRPPGMHMHGRCSCFISLFIVGSSEVP